MIHRNRGNRRFRDYTKAKRKAKIIREQKDYWYYCSLNVLNKGKIHCSCPMCAAKTNGKLQKSRGPVSNRLINNSLGEKKLCVYGHRISGTHKRYGRKNYCVADRKKVDRMLYQLQEYRNGEDEDFFTDEKSA